MATAMSLFFAMPQLGELHLRPDEHMTEEEFYQFCRLNKDWRIEHAASGEIIILPPTGAETGDRNSEITMQLANWAKSDGTGRALGSSAGFTLPNGAVRSPDAAWIQNSRLKNLSRHQKQRFPPVCPDFVLELLSPSDTLSAAKEKMAEYMDNGARLGWLIDPKRKHLYVYQPGRAVRRLAAPARISGGAVLPGFTLELHEIWNPTW